MRAYLFAMLLGLAAAALGMPLAWADGEPTALPDAAGLDAPFRALLERERALSAMLELALAAPPPDQAPAPASPPASTAKPTVVTGPDPAFQLGEAYCFPNPAAGGAVPTFHVEAGLADSVRVEVFDAGGERVAILSSSGPPGIVAGGRGPRYAFELRWDGPIATGVYDFTAEATLEGRRLRALGRCAVVR